MARRIPRYEVLGSITRECEGCGAVRECYQLKDRLTGKLRLACKTCMKPLREEKKAE